MVCKVNLQRAAALKELYFQNGGKKLVSMVEHKTVRRVRYWKVLGEKY